GDEPQRDHRGARPEPSLAGDPVHEVEAEPVGGRDALERAHAEVGPVGLAVARGDLELVPEVEGDGGAVEAGTEVGRRRRRAHCELHDAASAIASGSAGTEMGGAEKRPAASGSLSPWPVTTQT